HSVARRRRARALSGYSCRTDFARVRGTDARRTDCWRARRRRVATRRSYCVGCCHRLGTTTARSLRTKLFNPRLKQRAGENVSAVAPDDESGLLETVVELRLAPSGTVCEEYAKTFTELGVVLELREQRVDVLAKDTANAPHFFQQLAELGP